MTSFDDRAVGIDYSDRPDFNQPEWYKPMRPKGKDILRIVSDVIVWPFYQWAQSKEDWGRSFAPDPEKYPEWAKSLPDYVQKRTRYIAIVWILKSLNKGDKENSDLSGSVRPWDFSWQTRDILREKRDLFDPFKSVIRVYNNSESDDEAKFQKIQIDLVPDVKGEVPPDVKLAIGDMKNEVIEYLEGITPQSANYALFGSPDGPTLSIGGTTEVEGATSAGTTETSLEGALEELMSEFG